MNNKHSISSNKIVIESLSMDLLRVALGYHKGSIKMGDRFKREALKRCSEIETSQLRPNFARVLAKIFSTLSYSDTSRIAEDSLMYSTICRNYVKHYF